MTLEIRPIGQIEYTSGHRGADRRTFWLDRTSFSSPAVVESAAARED
jgi:hypothetical protein